jgi:putative peptidoglycan lipid II flippase
MTSGADLPEETPAPVTQSSLLRPTGLVVILTGVSRVAGFVRILVVAAVLGQTFLGNTYQSANTVPNILFELLIAGALQAVLVPTLVETFDRTGVVEAERVAGGVLGLATVFLGAAAGLAMALAPWIMRAFTAGVPDAAVRADQIRLGTLFLWIFLPQALFYAAGLVSTGVLNARERFALPALAPIVNNAIVIGAYLIFDALRGDRSPTLDLSWLEITVLAGGTTLGVIAFTAVPVVAVLRSGFRLRLRLDHRRAGVRRIARQGGWAAAYLASLQIQLAVVLVLANRIEGGVVTYQVGFAFYLLPHALVALPIATTMFPRLARRARIDAAAFARTVDGGLRAVGFVVVPAAAALAALAEPLSHLVLFGHGESARAEDLAWVLVGFAPGVVGSGAFIFLSRASYALERVRDPAAVNLVAVLAGAAVMVPAFAVLPDERAIAGLAAVVSVTAVAAACGLAWRLRGTVALRGTAIWWLRLGAAGIGGGASMRIVAARFDGSDPGRAAAVILGLAVGAVSYVAIVRLTGGPRPKDALRLLDAGAPE